MEAEATLTATSILVRLAIVLVLVFANGFFVAAEFALVGARRPRIDALARGGNRRAGLARRAIKRLDHYISGTQLGITLSSLGLGWVGESTLAAIIVDWFGGVAAPWDVIATHGVATAIAFAFITFLHIVLGELAPKSVALLYPETTSLWTAGPLIGFSKLLSPFIWALNGSANLFLRLVGLRPATEIERVHRPEEIEILVTQSYEHGLIREEPVEMIRGVFDLSDTTAAQVMTPRTEVVAVAVDASIDEAAELILANGHSRVPAYEDSLDRIQGIVLARDVWHAQREGRRNLAELVRPVPFVPEGRPLEGLLREMQAERVHMAIVVDEYGGTAGLVTIEDLLEEIVGEIRDEHEETERAIEETPAGDILVDGTTSIGELNDRYRLGLPEDEYTTVAGYVMGRLGRLPRTGDDVTFPSGRLRVVQMDGRRTRRLVLRLEPGREAASDSGSSRADEGGGGGRTVADDQGES